MSPWFRYNKVFCLPPLFNVLLRRVENWRWCSKLFELFGCRSTPVENNSATNPLIYPLKKLIWFWWKISWTRLLLKWLGFVHVTWDQNITKFEIEPENLFYCIEQSFCSFEVRAWKVANREVWYSFYTNNL